MRLAHVSFLLLATGVVACTSLLGDFSVDGSGPGSDDAGGNGEGGPGGPISITPADTKLGILRAQVFAAAGGPVTWSVQEGPAGGAIDDAGKYRSPPKPGVYHVVATSNADPSQKATVAVTVVPLGVSILAGTEGGRGNIDGSAAKAHFDNPRGLAFDSGITYVADTNNHTIRKFDQGTNQVTTIAGTPGVSGTVDGTGPAARFKNPTGLAFDSTAGILYVADAQNGCIRKVTPATGVVTTLSGSCGTRAYVDGADGASSRFDNISVMQLGYAKNVGGQYTALYTCEVNGSFRGIRRVDLASGATHTVTGLPAFNGCDLGVDYFQSQIFFNISWSNPQKIQRFKEGVTPASPWQAVLQAPDYGVIPNNGVFTNGMAVDTGYGNEHHVYMLNGSGSIDRMDAYNPGAFDAQPYTGANGDRQYIDGPIATARFASPTAILSEAAYSTMLVADSNAIRAIDDTGRTSPAVKTLFGAPAFRGRVDGVGKDVRFTGLTGVASDDQGIVYFSDAGFDSTPNNTIRRLDPTTGTVSTLAGVPQAGTGVVDDGPHDQAHFGFPFASVYAKGNLYVADLIGNSIRRVATANGAVTTFAGENKTPGASDGAASAAHFKFIDGGTGNGGAALVTDGTSLFVVDGGNFAIRRVDIATAAVTTIAGGTTGSANGVGKNAQFMAPTGIALDGGFLYVADAGDHTIRKIDVKTANVTTFMGLSGTPGLTDGDAAAATFTSPNALIADGLGNLYVTDGGQVLGAGSAPSGVIRRIDIQTRVVSTFAGALGKVGLSTGALPATLNCPVALTLTPQLDLALVDSCDAVIAAIKPL